MIESSIEAITIGFLVKFIARNFTKFDSSRIVGKENQGEPRSNRASGLNFAQLTSRNRKAMTIELFDYENVKQ